MVILKLGMSWNRTWMRLSYHNVMCNRVIVGSLGEESKKEQNEENLMSQVK